MVTKIKSIINRFPLEMLFVISAAAALSSLVLSNVLDYPPCDLCWYQRAFMFPLPFIFGTGLVLRDKRALVYGLPLIAVGAVIAIYHNLLQWGVISEDLLECSYTTVSCADPLINWFGFMTIPLGSLAVFALLGGISLVALKDSGDKLKADPQAANRLLLLAGGLLLATAIAVVMLS